VVDEALAAFQSLQLSARLPEKAAFLRPAPMPAYPPSVSTRQMILSDVLNAVPHGRVIERCELLTACAQGYRKVFLLCCSSYQV